LRAIKVPEAPHLDRRRFLKYVGAGAVAVGGAAAGYYVASKQPGCASTGTVVTPSQVNSAATTITVTKTTVETESCLASLRAAADARELLVGAAAEPDYFYDPPYPTTLAHEFNFATTETAMQWGTSNPDEGHWNFGRADALVEFANQHRMKIKGHPLVWDKFQLPYWVNSEMSADELRRAMQERIQTLVGRYKGKVYAWDVVNEAVDDYDGLRKGLFFNKLGEGYVAEAFRLAHEADPDVFLFYNDYEAEGLGGKSDRVYQLVKKLLNDGVPIDGIGLQMHISATDYPNPKEIAANIRRLTALGLKVNISEMDVRIRDLTGSLPKRLEVQQQVYHDIIAACIKEQGFIAVTFWGFTDAHSWIDSWFGADDPLLFDEDYKPKPAYWGVLEALLGE